MSFERFTTTSADWDAAPAPLAEPLPFQRDPRCHDVLCEIEFLEQQPRPAALSDMAWFELLRDLRHVAENWLDIALAGDWSLIDLFGSPPRLNGRVGLMGVAVLLKGRSIESIDRDRIVIANRLGAPNVFYRHVPGVSVPVDRTGSELIWDVIAKGEMA